MCKSCVSGPKNCGDNETEEKQLYEWILFYGRDWKLPVGSFVARKDGERYYNHNYYVGRLERDGDNSIGRVRSRQYGFHRYYGHKGIERRTSGKFSVLCVELDAEIEWVEFKDGILPDNAVNGGIVDGQTQYVGRGTTHNQTIPGMFVPSDAKLQVLYGGEVLELREFDVLVVTRNETRVKIIEALKDSETETLDDSTSNEETVDDQSEHLPEKRILLSESGEISVSLNRKDISPTRYETGQFCMAGVWEGDLKVRDDEAIALICPPCKSQVGFLF